MYIYMKQTIYLWTSLPHALIHGMALASHVSSWTESSWGEMSFEQKGHFTVLKGQEARWPANSPLCVRRMHPLGLKMHSTTCMAHSGLCPSKAETGPVHWQPGIVAVEGHLINLFFRTPSTARFLISGLANCWRSTGQVVCVDLHWSIHDLQKMWPESQVTGSLNTA